MWKTLIELVATNWLIADEKNIKKNITLMTGCPARLGDWSDSELESFPSIELSQSEMFYCRPSNMKNIEECNLLKVRARW